MSAFDPLPPPSAIQRALPPGTRIDGVEIGPAVAEDAATVSYRATGPRGEFLLLSEYMPAQIALREPDGAVLSVDDGAFRAGLSAFLEEARVLQRADHPSLIGVMDVLEARGTAYRTSPWVDGARLVDIRRQMTEPPDEEALRDLLDGLLGGLNAWQREGGLHGAVTPANILLLANDRPLLLGPNRALHAGAGERLTALVTSDEPSFAPVEQIAPTADLPLGLTADYYALAGVIRYCLSGQLPPPALGAQPPRESMRELARRVRQSWPKLHYGEALLDTLEAALSHRPDERPQSIAQFRAWLNTGTGRAPAPVPVPERMATGPAPIIIDPIDPIGSPGSTIRARPGHAPPAGRPPRRAPAVPIEPTGSFATLGSIPPPERDSEPASPFFGLEGDGGDRPNRFDDYERFDRIEHDVRHSSTPPPRVPPPRRWGALAATMVGVLLVIGAVAGVREFDRRREADRTLEIARDAIDGPPAGAAPRDSAGTRPTPPAVPPATARRDLELPSEPTAAGPARAPAMPNGTGGQQPAAAAAAPPVTVQQLPGQQLPPQQQVPQQQAPQQQVPPQQMPQQQVLQQPRQQVVQPPPQQQTPAPQATQQQARQQPMPQRPLAQDSAAAVESAVPTVQVAPGTPPPRVEAAPRPAPAPTNPREVCGPRTEFSLYRCMTQQCAQLQWRFHPQCERLRRFDRVD